jgi:hypothetical protein
MTKPVTIPNAFQAQVGPIPLSQLDADFTAVAGVINDYGTYNNYLVDSSGGANSITVATPAGTTYVPIAGMQLQVKLANTNTSTAVTITVNVMSGVPVVNSDGVTLPAVGQLVAGQILFLTFDGTSYRLGSGGSLTLPFYARTAAEISASVIPSNYAYPPGNVLRYGADPAGVAESSTAFQNACNSSYAVTVPPPNVGAKYIVQGVTIPGGCVVQAAGSFIVDKAGAAFIFKLTGFGSRLIGAYISSATNCSQAALIIDQGQYCGIEDTRIFNATSGLILEDTSNGVNGCNKTFLSNIQIDTFTTYGVYTGPNVQATFAENVYCDCGTIAGGGGQIPRLGCVGFAFVGTGSTSAFGGHTYVNCIAINMQDGWRLTDTNLVKLTNCVSDTLCGIAYLLNGNTNCCDLTGCFAGTCAVAVQGGGTSVNNKVVALRSYGIGNLPAFGGTNWYTQNSYAAPFYELVQTGTAIYSIELDTWQATNGPYAHNFIEAVPLAIVMTGGFRLQYNSNGTVAAGATVYLGINGQQANSISTSVTLPYDSVACPARCVFLHDTAPGAGQTFTYTLSTQSGGSTGIVGVSTGAATFQATVTGPFQGIPNQNDIYIKLVTSAGAGVGHHRGYVLIIPQPG